MTYNYTAILTGSIDAGRHGTPGRARAPLISHGVVFIGGEQIACKTLNVAVIGIAIPCPVRRRVGSSMRLEFKLPSENDWVRVTAKLIREERYYQSYLWGVKFEDIDEETQRLLSAYVDKHLAA